MAFQRIRLFHHPGKGHPCASGSASSDDSCKVCGCEHFRHLRLRLLYMCEPGFVEMKETEKGSLAKF